MKGIKTAVQEGAVTNEALYFDNTIATAGELRQNWPRPAKETWLNRYFQTVTS